MRKAQERLQRGRPRIRGADTTAPAASLCKAADAGGNGTGVREAAHISEGLPILEAVDELFRGPAHSGRALCFRWKSRLQPVRLQHQQRAALGSRGETDGAIEGWPSRAIRIERRIHHGKITHRIPAAEPLASRSALLG